MSDKVQFKDEELPQENYEGVDPNEWVIKRLFWKKYSFLIVILFNRTITDGKPNVFHSSIYWQSFYNSFNKLFNIYFIQFFI